MAEEFDTIADKVNANLDLLKNEGLVRLFSLYPSAYAANQGNAMDIQIVLYEDGSSLKDSITKKMVFLFIESKVII